ncbi:MAG: aryl-sulfate sulfotransferase [Candidatus Acidiferrum sp.]
MLFFAAGCGGSYSTSPPPPPAPAVMIAPNPVIFPAISEGAASTPTVVAVTNSGSGTLNIASIVVGGTNSADFTTTNTCTMALTASGSCNISVTFAPAHSGSLSETITLTDNAPNSPQVIGVSGTATALAIILTPSASAMGVSQTIPFTASGDPNGVTWSVVGAPFLGSPAVVTSPGTITSAGSSAGAPVGGSPAANYSGPGSGPSFYATVTATSKTDPTKFASATVNVVAPGAFTSTLNVQVAQYSVALPSPATASVQFGLTTSYGLTTWTQPSPANLATPFSLYVAGMTQSTPYHMQGLIQFADGTSFSDADFTFTTGALPAGTVPNITATTTANMTPQSGVEMLDLLSINAAGAAFSPLAVTDLAGNVLWAYNPTLAAGVAANPIKLLSNGHFLINFAAAVPTDGLGSFMQEIDLGGNIIWQMTAAQLNTALAAATCAECNVTVIGTHHDFVVLPNGHLIVIASTTETLSDDTTPVGDIIIDLGDMENVGGNNPNHLPQPVWAWNEFNHLDTNRRPYSYPDWTHTNALLYSSSDGDLIISIRHQNWLVKLPYANGTGSGDPVWKLGAVLPTDTTPEDTADFSLLNADGTSDTNLTDWFYAQHGPSFTTANTSGQFSLILFDNGDDRDVSDAPGDTCGGNGIPCFSTVPVFTIDETAKTATFVINPTTPDYSYFGGNAEVLKNGNVEYDECATTAMTDTAHNAAAIYEVTQTSSPQAVWQMIITGQFAYRGFRMPSFYPGVQW